MFILLMSSTIKVLSIILLSIIHHPVIGCRLNLNNNQIIFTVKLIIMIMVIIMIMMVIMITIVIIVL